MVLGQLPWFLPFVKVPASKNVSDNYKKIPRHRAKGPKLSLRTGFYYLSSPLLHQHCGDRAFPPEMNTEVIN